LNIPFSFSSFAGMGLGLSVGISLIVLAQSSLEEEEEEIIKQAGSYKDGLREYTRAEVSKHKTFETRIWVTFRRGVYDITDFVEVHPGSLDKIMLAAGTALEPFWDLYGQHLTLNVLEILESMRIGNLQDPSLEESPLPYTIGSPIDQYSDEPPRDPALVVRSKKPFNAETPRLTLIDHWLTPNTLFYVRNHLPVPKVDPESFQLTISGEELQEPLVLTLEDLKTHFPKEVVVATLQCSGNRRNDMNRVKSVRGGSWEFGAISNAIWGGVSLRQILIRAGLDPQRTTMKHVHFTGLDRDSDAQHYAASIPVEKALDPAGDVIIAYEMNGSPLSPDHGFPLRVIVPGISGARNVKWLSRIHASSIECPSHWQQKDYKGFSPMIDWHNVDWTSSPAIQETPVQSAICVPSNGEKLSSNTKEITVKGYAYSGGGRGIVRVDVSIDGGKIWHLGEFLQPSNQTFNRNWAWTQWKASIPIPEEYLKTGGQLDICCKAIDSSYNVQPELIDPIWNLRGVLCNSWHHVNVTIDPLSEIDS